jgi:hypothetical protein
VEQRPTRPSTSKKHLHRAQGQCGVDRRQAAVDVPLPTRVAALGGVPVASVAAGGSHSVAVSRDGAAYAWGCGLDGQIGSGAGAPSAAEGGCLAAGLGVSSAAPLLVEGPGLDEEDVVQVGLPFCSRLCVQSLEKLHHSQNYSG